MAGGMPWVKVYTEMLDDPKMAKINDIAKWRFIQLILVAAECDAGGAFVVGDDVMTVEEIAWRLRMDKNTLDTDIKILIKAGILSTDGKVLEIPKFADRQGPTQKEKRATWKERQQKRRERVTRDSRAEENDCHALEKSREEKNREDEEKESLPQIFIDGDLLEYEQVFQKDTGLGPGLYRIDEAYAVWSKMKADGVTPQDMHMGTLNLQNSQKDYTISRPQSVRQAAYTAKQKRIYEEQKQQNQPREKLTIEEIEKRDAMAIARAAC